MLVDVKIRQFDPELLGPLHPPVRVERGVYEHQTHNFELWLEDRIPLDSRYFDFNEDDRILQSYGVCDSYQQVLEHYGIHLMGDRPFVLAVTRVRKDEQSERGGWRWHKWGPYIGTQEPQTEYLYDEPAIEEVFCFRIIAVPESLIANV